MAEPRSASATLAPFARGVRGAVVAPHHLATAAGLEILRHGGSAVDAAIATNAVLAVVMPNGCGVGGDAFWLIWDAARREHVGLNGSGPAAAALTADRMRGRGFSRMPMRGPDSITVPGAVRSWAEALRRYGRRSPADILAPAIELARDGFPAWGGFVTACERTAEVVEEAVGTRAGFFEVYRPHRRPWQLGEVVRLPALASTLETLAADGFDAFYDGQLAKRQATGLAAAGSAITADDLRRYRAEWTVPISTTYRGVRVTTHPPNSSGAVALELLNVLERFAPPDDSSFGSEGVRDPAWIHLGIEAAKLAMADRDRDLADPAFLDVPTGRFTDKRHAASLAARIDPRQASVPAASTNPPGGGTIYVAVVDADGNAVSLIQSNYSGFGSGVVDPATGIHYQNRGSYFTLEPGHPNELAPGKRPLHTLLPGMLFRDAADGTPAAGPWIVLGSMGGDAQPQIHAQVVSALVDGGVDVATAVGAPRWFVEPEAHFAPPIAVRAEPRFAPGVLEALEAMGHEVTRTAPFDGWLGHCHAIELVDGGPAHGGSLAAATDPRSAGLPAAR